MPTPFEILSDPVSLAVFFLYGALIGWETLFPARPLPDVKSWKLRGLLAFTVYFFLSSYLPLLWSESLASFQLLDLSGIGVWGGALAGVLMYEAGVYWWHRSMHGSTILWRGFHQMHHSSERLDAYSAFWFSPLDMAGWTALFSLCMALLGLAPEAITLVLLTTTFMSIFQHSNIRTPRWLGYLVQRPESHSRHHARGIHAGNYADLPIFDLLFGTFYNPRDFSAETGFHHGASARLAEMLTFRNVSQPSSQILSPQAAHSTQGEAS